MTITVERDGQLWGVFVDGRCVDGAIYSRSAADAVAGRLRAELGDGGTFRIWCRVSGGVTGTREAWLKSDGGVVEFGDRAAAEAEARRLNEKMNHPYATADFRYSVVDMRSGR